MANTPTSNGARVPLPFPPLDPRRDDPAWQPPTDPASDPKEVERAASIINREIPVGITSLRWSWPAVRAALDDISTGIFDRPAQLCDAIMGDARMQAAMGSRTGGLLGRPAKFEPSHVGRVKGSRAAKEALDAWIEAWPTISQESAFSQMHTWGVVLGFGPAQLLWDTTVTPWVPHVVPFYPRYTYYQFVYRAMIAITLDGQVPITPGDGHWVLHAPYGVHRGWMRGAVMACAQPWIQRKFAYRDVARFCERHGYPIPILKTPATADPTQIKPLRAAVANMGQESILELPQGVDDSQSYGIDLLEAKDATWEVFPESIRLCDADITLAILFQNLTTEVKEGSFAAARVHGDVRQSAIEFDNRAMTATIHDQIARPFCALNFGDPDLAPWTSRDVMPYEDNKMSADTFAAFATAVKALRDAGHRVKDPEALAWSMGIRLSLGQLESIEPTQVQTAQARGVASGDDDEEKGGKP